MAVEIVNTEKTNGLLYSVKSAEMSALVTKALEFIKQYDLTNFSVSANSGDAEHGCFGYARAVDKNGYSETYTIDENGGVV